MGNQTIQSITVETTDQKLARLRKEYIMVEWPKFLDLFPGMPGYRTDAILQQRALEMLELGKAAQVSVTGSPWDPEDLDTLNNRPIKDFLNHLKSNYNRINLADQWRVVRDNYLLDSRMEAA